MRIADPYAGVDWADGVRGNLHAHSRQSDGASEPQEVIAAYGDAGYGFLMLSDHDTYTSAEAYARWDAHGLVLIPGAEVTCDGPHVLQIGGAGKVQAVEDRQRVIDDIRSGGGLAVMNHPNWHNDNDHCPQEVLQKLERYAGIEIYNAVINELTGSSYALDRWDRLLGRARRVWGFANDDAHRLDHIGQGWNVAFPRERTADGIIEALREGRFYASTGVAIERIAVDGPTLTISAPEAERIIAIGDWGQRLAKVDGPVMAFEVPPKVTYVRFECWGRGERFAWSQPFFVER